MHVSKGASVLRLYSFQRVGLWFIDQDPVAQSVRWSAFCMQGAWRSFYQGTGFQIQSALCQISLRMLTSSNANTFRVSGHLCGGIRRSPMNSPHKGQWRRTLMFSLICAWINGWVNTRETGDLRRHGAHYDVTVMDLSCILHVPSAQLYINFLMSKS